MAASDAVADLTTLAGAFGQFSNSLLSLFDARVESEANRVAVQINNRQTEFLLDFDRLPGDPRAITTGNWTSRLDEYINGMQNDLGTIQSEPVRNAVTRMYNESQNKFKLQVSDKMIQKTMTETRENMASSLSGIVNAKGSSQARAANYRSMLDGIAQKGYFSKPELDVFESQYRILQAAGWGEELIATATDRYLPFEEASSKSLSIEEATQDQKGFMQTDIQGRSDAADKAADSMLKTLENYIKGGRITYEQAEKQLKVTTSSEKWRNEATAKIGLLADEELVKQAVKYVADWESKNTQGAASESVANFYRQKVLALGDAHTTKGATDIQTQLEKIKVKTEDDVTEANKKNEAQRLYGIALDSYNAKLEGWTGRRFIAEIDKLSSLDASLVNKVKEQFRKGEIQDNDGFIKAFFDISEDKSLLLDLSGALGKTTMGDSIRSVLKEGRRTGSVADIMVNDMLLTIADTIRQQNSTSYKMSRSEFSAYATKVAKDMVGAEKYWRTKQEPGTGKTSDLEKQLYDGIKYGDTGGLALTYSRDEYYNRQSVGQFTQYFDNVAGLLRRKIDEGISSGIPSLSGYKVEDLTPRMVNGTVMNKAGQPVQTIEMYLVTSDGKYAFGLDAGDKKGIVSLKRYNIDYGADKNPGSDYDDKVYGGAPVVAEPANGKPGPAKTAKPALPLDQATEEKSADILKGKKTADLTPEERAEWIKQMSGGRG